MGKVVRLTEKDYKHLSRSLENNDNRNIWVVDPDDQIKDEDTFESIIDKYEALKRQIHIE